MQKVSALDLKERQQMENHMEVKTLAQSQSISMSAATTTFLVTSAAAYCLLIAY
jgi:hypothetical protein